jgi:uncharacterized protein
MKIALVVLAVVVLWWLVFGRKRVSASKASRAAPPAAVTQPMLACAFCGVHLPQSEALVVGKAAFCGPEHRLAFERDSPRP